MRPSPPTRAHFGVVRLTSLLLRAGEVYFVVHGIDAHPSSGGAAEAPIANMKLRHVLVSQLARWAAHITEHRLARVVFVVDDSHSEVLCSPLQQAQLPRR